MQADPWTLPLQLPCSSCSALPRVLTTQHSSLVGSRSSSGLRGATSEAAAENPQPGPLQPELLSSRRVPNRTQSWSLFGQFLLDQDGAAQRNSAQGYSPHTVAGDHACGCNALSALSGEALGSIKRGSVNFLRHLSTKMLGNTKRPAPQHQRDALLLQAHLIWLYGPSLFCGKMCRIWKLLLNLAIDLL